MSSWEDKLRSAAKKKYEKDKSFTSRITRSSKPKMTITTQEQKVHYTTAPPTYPSHKKLEPEKQEEKKVITLDTSGGHHRSSSNSRTQNKITREETTQTSTNKYKPVEGGWETKVKTTIKDDSGKEYKIKSGGLYDNNKKVGIIRNDTIELQDKDYENKSFSITQQEEKKPVNVMTGIKRQSWGDDVRKKYKRLTGKEIDRNYTLGNTLSATVSGLAVAGERTESKLHSKAEEWSLSKNPAKRLAAPFVEFGSRTASVLTLPYNLAASKKEVKYEDLTDTEKGLYTNKFHRKKDYEYGADVIDAALLAKGASDIAAGIEKKIALKEYNIKGIKSSNKVLDDLGVSKITDKEAKIIYKLDKPKKVNLADATKKIQKALDEQGLGERVYTKRATTKTLPRTSKLQIDDLITTGLKSKFKDTLLLKKSEPVLDVIKRGKSTTDVLTKSKGTTYINLGDDVFGIVSKTPDKQVTKIYRGTNLMDYKLTEKPSGYGNIWRSKEKFNLKNEKLLDDSKKYFLETRKASKYEGGIFNKNKLRNIEGYNLENYKQATTGKNIFYEVKQGEGLTNLETNKLKFDLNKKYSSIDDFDKLFYKNGVLKSSGKEYKTLSDIGLSNKYRIGKPVKIESKFVSRTKTFGYKAKDTVFKVYDKVKIENFDKRGSYDFFGKSKLKSLFGDLKFERRVSKPKINKFNYFEDSNILKNFVSDIGKFRTGSSLFAKSYLSSRAANMFNTKFKSNYKFSNNLKPATTQKLNVNYGYTNKTKTKTQVDTTIKPYPTTTTTTSSTTKTTTTTPSNINYNFPVTASLPSITRGFKPFGGAAMPFNSYSGSKNMKKYKYKTKKDYNKYLRDMWKTLNNKRK